MARKITDRIKIKGELITESPLHVGGISLDAKIDLALAVDGQSRYYIPGTSFAGALRQWMNANFGASITDSLWGHQDEKKARSIKKTEQPHASFVIIEDAYFAEIRVETRDGVGIDRHLGRAADKGKFDRAIIPKGAKCNFEMSVEIGKEADFSTALNQLLDALCAGEIRLGAAKTRGLGRVKLIACQTLTQTLNTKAGMLQALTDTFQSSCQNYTPQTAIQTAQLQIQIGWKPIGAVMVKDAIEGNSVDMLPLTSADGKELALVIPGSSIKGALRSQAERIVRTVINRSTTGKFIEQVQVPIVENLFGAAANEQDKKLGQGALFVDDCYSQNRTTHSKWQQVIQANTEGELIANLSNANLASIQQATHVAIDRWTGGAAEHMLYSNLEPFGIDWAEIELTVMLDRLTVNQEPDKPDKLLASIGLLLLVLRDLYQQKITLGYGANRGMGAIEVTSIHINGQGLEDELTDFNLSINANGTFAGIDSNLLTKIDRAWQNAINHQQEVQTDE